MGSKFDKTIEAYGCEVTAFRVGNAYIAGANKNGGRVHTTYRHRGPGARLAALMDCLAVLQKKFTAKTAKKIKFSKFKQLEFSNSKKLPPIVTINGQTKHWVGVGWIEEDYDPKAPVIVDD